MDDLSGKWIGFYTDPNNSRLGEGGEFRLEATLIQMGDRIRGTMIDLDWDNVTRLSAMLEDPSSATWPALDRANIEALVRRDPQASFRSVLPERSLLAGRVSGRNVELEKRYQGRGFSATVVEGREIGRRESESLPILYAGTLDEAAQEIWGEWTISKGGLLGGGTVLNRGAFRLARKP